MFAKGLAEYRLGRHESAIALMEQCAAGSMGPPPASSRPWPGIARDRRPAHARPWQRRSSPSIGVRRRRTIGIPPGSPTSSAAKPRSLILSELPSFLEGHYQPRDNDERLALLGVCQFKDLRAAQASLYAAAFAADPKLADDLKAGHRYRAARAAAVAGRGGGADGAGLSEPEQTRWREQAREWLRAEVSLWAKALDGGPQTDRVLARDRLTHLSSDSDLAGLLDPESLDGLPPAERQECRALRGELDALIRRAQSIK